jgi:hypothetical protein
MLSTSEDGSYRVWRSSDPLINNDNKGFGCLENVYIAVPSNDVEDKKPAEKPPEVSEQTKHPTSQMKTTNEMPQQPNGNTFPSYILGIPTIY